MIKIVNRLIILNAIIGYILSNFLSIGGQKTGALTALETFSFFWVLITVLGLLYLWGYLFYHWSKQVFINRAVKIFWFLVILIGGFLYFYGSLVYYLVVVELKRTLRPSV